MIYKLFFFILTYVTPVIFIHMVFLFITAKKGWLRIVFGVLGVLFLIPGAVLIPNLFLSQNQSRVKNDIVLDSWDVTTNSFHNAYTDLVEYKGKFFMIHTTSYTHIGTNESFILIKESEDKGQTFRTVGIIDSEDYDLQDPKLMVYKGKLIAYGLANQELKPFPTSTVYSVSEDGHSWSALDDTGLEEWLLRRPKTGPDGKLYVAADYFDKGASALFSSQDGTNWKRLADINSGNFSDETAIAFLSNGDMVVTCRLEYSRSIFGHKKGSTLILKSQAPYTDYQILAQSPVTRLDGPRLFVYQNRVFAVGRYHYTGRWPWQKRGSIFTRKRASLFEVTPRGLVRLTDLPSAGTTSYAGVVIEGNEAYVSYFTSDISRDYLWFTGFFMPSSLRMAKIDLRALAAASGLE